MESALLAVPRSTRRVPWRLRRLQLFDSIYGPKRIGVWRRSVQQEPEVRAVPACRRSKISTYRSSELEAWIASSIPPQAGRLAIVTSATTEQGYATAEALARAGADVILTAANEAEGRAATAALRPLAPAALIRFEKLDPGSLASIADFAGRIAASGRAIDLLVHIGSGDAPQQRAVTADGFERELAIGCLAPFALTARLLPLLRRSRRPRVVSALAADPRRGAIDLDDLQLAQSYSAAKADAQAALAAVLFARELQRRSDAAGWGLLSAAVQAVNDAEMQRIGNGFLELVRRLGGAFGLLESRPGAGAASLVLFAATAPIVRPGGFYGAAASLSGTQPEPEDPAVAAQLWTLCEQLTSVEWPK